MEDRKQGKWRVRESVRGEIRVCFFCSAEQGILVCLVDRHR
jgi:hypothetical protein